MKNIRLFIFILAIFLMLGLVACTRSASQPPTAPPGEGEEAATPEGTPAVLDVLKEAARQTEMAESGETEPQEAEPSGEEPAEETEVAAEEGSPAEGEPAAEVVEEGSPAETEAPEEGSEQGGGQEPVTVPEYEVPNKYTLHAGEFPWCIARRFNIDISALLSANGLNTNSNVYPGTTLTIPKNAGPYAGARALHAHPTNYTVQYNDTIYTIACYFGDVDPRAIEAVNGLTGSYTLTSGDVIKIP